MVFSKQQVTIEAAKRIIIVINKNQRNLNEK